MVSTTEVSTPSAEQLLQRFQAAQTQRAHLYSRFHEGFRRFLETGQEGIYRRLMLDLMGSFSECSRSVMALEGQLREGAGRPDLADLLITVQNNERDKLQATVAVQALRGAFRRQQFSWQHPEQHPERHQSENSQGIGEALPGVCIAHADPHGPSAPEPSEADYQLALTEAYRKLQTAITAINDALEEVRYALQDEQPAGEDAADI